MELGSSIVRLITLAPEVLRDQIEQLADLGWLASVWTLREWQGNWRVAIKRIDYHWELLLTFRDTAGLDSRRWNRDYFLSQLKLNLSDVQNRLGSSEHSSLLIYENVIRLMGVISPHPTSQTVIDMLTMADTCLEILFELERLADEPAP